MAKIDVNLNQGVDLSGASFVNPGHVADNTQTAKQVTALAEGGIDIFKAGKRAAAAEQSKSLLEEFTGFKRKSEIAAKEDELLDTEGSLREDLNNAAPGTIERDLTNDALMTLEKTKDSLARDRAAVDQGLLSLEDYRRRAETMFYQQVVHTPGLKNEIAAVMTEYLGVDPRGQEAAIEIENRKAAAKANATQNTKLKSQMIGDGYWVSGKSDEWNFQNMAQANLDYRQALKRMEFNQANLNLLQDMDKDGRQRAARRTLADMNTLQGNALDGMSKLGDLNLFELTYPEVRELSEDDRALWMSNIRASADQFLNIIGQQQAGNEEIGTKADPLRQSIEARRDLLIDILSQNDSQELLEQKLNRLKSLNDITVQSRVSDVFVSQPNAQNIAAMREIAGESNLTGKAVIENVMLKLFRGDTPDLVTAEPEERNDTLRGYEAILQGVSRSLDAGFELNEEQLGAVVKQLSGMSRHYPDELNSRVRQQMDRIASNKELMNKYKTVDPRGYDNFMKSLMNNQQVELESLAEDMANKEAMPSRYFLSKEDDVWLLTPTTLAVDNHAEANKPRGRSAVGRKGEHDKDSAEKVLRDKVQTINLSRGLITNMIRSRQQALGISEQAAAREVATSLGLSLKDLTKAVTAEENKGFGDDFRSKDNRPTPKDINMDDLSVEELNALSDASQAAVEARNKAAQ